MKKLRLLLFEECDRHCVGCCNDDWDLSKLPIVKSYKGYDEILLTGGEPMLLRLLVKYTIAKIRTETDAPIYLYTARTAPVTGFLHMLYHVDGICVTLHEQYDVPQFLVLNDLLVQTLIDEKSLRLNIFKGIHIGKNDISKWKVKRNIEWIKNCPLPKDEVFMRL